MFPVCSGQFLSEVVQGRNSGEPVTGSWAAKPQRCMWGPIQQTSYCCSNCGTGPWSNGRRWPGLMNHVFHLDGWVHVRRLPGEHMAPGCTMRRKQVDGGSVMLWVMFCWGPLGPAIHVDITLTPTTYLVVDHVSGLFQQDNVSWHKAKQVQEWFELSLRGWPGLQIPQVIIQSSICGMCWTNKSGGPAQYKAIMLCLISVGT